MSMQVDTGNTLQVAAGLEGAAARLADPTDLVQGIAAKVAAQANARVPRRTGVLAASFSADPGTVNGNPAATLTWGVRYAVFVNFGTRHMSAQPFATDALTAVDADGELTTWANQIIGGI